MENELVTAFETFCDNPVNEAYINDSQFVDRFCALVGKTSLAEQKLLKERQPIVPGITSPRCFYTCRSFLCR